MLVDCHVPANEVKVKGIKYSCFVTHKKVRARFPEPLTVGLLASRKPRGIAQN